MDYSNIHGYYLKRFREIARGRILKTDCYNESIGEPIVTTENAVLIEYDPESLAGAFRQNDRLRLVKGDIRHLNYNCEFDTIVDFSTIDHIKESEVSLVLEGYQKALAKEGRILLIAWMREGSAGDTEEKPWEPSNQYYFDFDVFRKLFSQFFVLREGRRLLDGESEKRCLPGTFLYEFYGVGIS